MENQSRLEVLEGRVEELSRHWHDLFVELGRVDQRIDALGVALSGRIDALEQKFDRRIDALEETFDRRFEGVDRRFEGIDRRFDTIDRKFDDLRAELSKQFRWTFSTMLALLGMMLTVGAGVATALLRN